MKMYQQKIDIDSKKSEFIGKKIRSFQIIQICNVASVLASKNPNLIHIDLVLILSRVACISRLLIKKPPIFFIIANQQTYTHIHTYTRAHAHLHSYWIGKPTLCGRTLTHDSNQIHLSNCMTFEFENEIVVRFEQSACV